MFIEDIHSIKKDTQFLLIYMPFILILEKSFWDLKNEFGHNVPVM